MQSLWGIGGAHSKQRRAGFNLQTVYERPFERGRALRIGSLLSAKVGYSFIAVAITLPHMAKDTKLDSIELKVSFEQINTDKQRLCAKRIQERWPEVNDFNEYAEIYPKGEPSEEGTENPSESLYRNVYRDYFGPEDDPRTVGELRDEFGSITEYLEAKKHTDVGASNELDIDDALSSEEFAKLQEAYRKGYRDAQEDLRSNG